MNIVYNNKQNTYEFRMVARGNVFLFNGNAYVKIQTVKSNSGIRYNAITLQDGLLMTFTDTDNVTIADADLVIK